MWWEPGNKREADLVGLIERLRGAFIERDERTHGLYGIGSILQDGVRRLLVLADPALLPASHLLPFYTYTSPFRWPRRKPTEPAILVAREAGDRLGDALESLEVPPDTCIIQTQRPDGNWQDDVGVTYATAMALIIVQVPNEYLPIFQK